MRTIFFIALAALMAFSVNAQTMVKSMKDLDYGVEVKTIKVKGNISVAYTDEGKGAQTLVFIHGLASYIPAWKKNTAVLKNNYRCIAIDLPGYGKSDKANYEVSMEFYADVVAELCSQLKLSQVVLVGHSMGGQVAISAALKYPELVARLVLIAPAGFETFNKGQRQWFRDVMTADGVRLTTAEQIRINYAYNFYNMPDDAAFMIDDRLAIRSASDFGDYCYHITQGVNAMVNTPVYDFLPQVLQPTLCIYGANDNLIPNRFLNGGKTEKYARAGASRMPNCKLEMIKDCGHFVMFEKPEEVNTFIANFLGSM